MKREFYHKIGEIEDDIKNYYRYLHRYPELSGREYKTQAWILDQLRKWEVECRPCADTGVYAVIRTGRPGHTIALRADMDALPVTEHTGLPWESRRKGVMHACGHDAHMAILLGCIRILQGYRDSLCGNVVFIFQPSEEQQGGAERMIKEGALEHPSPEFAAALHVWPQEAGSITCMSGPVMAQPDAFRIEIRGKGGHGAAPHLCRNPIPALASLVNAIGNITADVVSPQEMAVVNVCRIQCGEKYNVVSETGCLEGTIRTYDNAVREKIIRRLKRLTVSTAEAWEMEGTYSMSAGYPATINDRAAASWAARILQKKLRGIKVFSEGEASMLGEDFSYFGKYCPSLFLRLGCWKECGDKQYPLHNSCFEIDESVLAEGVEVFCVLASVFTERGFGA